MYKDKNFLSINKGQNITISIKNCSRLECEVLENNQSSIKVNSYIMYSDIEKIFSDDINTNNNYSHNKKLLNKFYDEIYRLLKNNSINSYIEPIFKYNNNKSTSRNDEINRILASFKNKYNECLKINDLYGYYHNNEILNENLKTYPRIPVFHMLKGVMLQKLKKFNDAIQSFQIAAVLSHKSGEWIHWLNLAKIEDDNFIKFFALHMIITKIKEDDKNFITILYSYINLAVECGFKSIAIETLIIIHNCTHNHRDDLNKLYMFLLLYYNIYDYTSFTYLLQKFDDNSIFISDIIYSFIEENIDIEIVKLKDIELMLEEIADKFLETHNNYISFRDNNIYSKYSIYNDINSTNKEYEINGLLETVENAGVCGSIIVDFDLIETVLRKQKNIGELGWLEFKQDFSDTEYIWNDVIRPIIAMRNTIGGLILYGISDNGEIIGINSKKDIKKYGDTDFIRRSLISKINKQIFKTSKFHYDMTCSEWHDIDNCNWLRFSIKKINGKHILAVIVYPVIPNNPGNYYIKEIKINDNSEKKYFLVRNKYAESKRIDIHLTNNDHNHDAQIEYAKNCVVEYFKKITPYYCDDLKQFLKDLFH